MRATLTCAVALLTAACNPLEFEDLRDRAQTIGVAPADDYPNLGFGQVVTAYGGTLGGTFQSRVAATAGPDTPYSVYPVYIDRALRLDVPTVDGCDEEAPCRPGAGGVLFGLPGWGSREICIGTISPAAGEIRMRCEDDLSRSELIGGPAGEGFGESVAALDAAHPFGRAVIGAPGASAGAGAVYRLPDAAPPVALDLSVAAGVGGALGSAVAVGALDADTVLVAASAPGDPSRIVTATVDVAGDGTVTTTVTACIDGSAGAGAALAIADLDGDGLPDLVASSVTEGADVVRVYSGATMPGACADWPAATEIGCPAVEGVECDDSSQLGAALAVGDVNADGVTDLLATAPEARVDGVGGAGAAYVFTGGSLGALSGSDRVVALRHSSPNAGDRLGAAAAMAPGLDGRHEPVLGAPGADRVYVFLCSGLEGDSPANTGEMRCQPEE